MSDCNQCKHYYEELDVNYFECLINEDEKYWCNEEDCPSFEAREEMEMEENE